MNISKAVSRKDANRLLRPFEGMMFTNLSCLFSAERAAHCRRRREYFSSSLDRTRLRLFSGQNLIAFSELNVMSSDVLFTPNTVQSLENASASDIKL